MMPNYAQNPICHKNKPFFIKNTKRINNFSFPHLYLNVITDGAYTKKRERATKVSDLDRDDIHQIISYMHVLPSNIGGLLYPSKSEPPATLIQSTLKGYGGTMTLFPVHIPVVDNWNDFLQQIKSSESKLISDIENITA